MEHNLWLKELNQNSDSDHSFMSKKAGSVEMLLIHCTKKIYSIYHRALRKGNFLLVISFKNMVIDEKVEMWGKEFISSTST